MSGPTFNQSHSGFGHNIINIGKPEFKIPEADWQAMEIGLTPHRGRKMLISAKAQAKSQKIGQEIKNFLEQRGFDVEPEIRQILAHIPPETPISINLNEQDIERPVIITVDLSVLD